MHHPLIAATLILAALPLVFGSETGFAQGQQGQSQQGLPNFKPPPMQIAAMHADQKSR